MGLLDSLSSAFQSLRECWRGGSEGEIQAHHIVAAVIRAAEKNKKEGQDGKVYVPSKYIIRLISGTPEEMKQLLAMLDDVQIESDISHRLKARKYFIAGELDITLEEMVAQDEFGSDKFIVDVRWDMDASDPSESLAAMGNFQPSATNAKLPESLAEVGARFRVSILNEGMKEFLLTKPLVKIGRSARSGNDIVIGWDGKVSKLHASVSAEEDGYTIFDMNSTNGVWINDERLTPSKGYRLLNGDEVRLGHTELLYVEESPVMPPDVEERWKPRLTIFSEKVECKEFFLPAELTIGMALGSGLRIDDASVSRLHARIFSSDGKEYYIEDTSSEYGTMINGVPIESDCPVLLRHGDRVCIGRVKMRFEVV